ncbi:MAG: hypothetical protein DSZ32_00850 [Gammaproteobacteria bacterium]|nr:MAG: hypothetical protein DSZ32_00850 [Gammaproteobacteria bacterium]
MFDLGVVNIEDRAAILNYDRDCSDISTYQYNIFILRESLNIQGKIQAPEKVLRFVQCIHALHPFGACAKNHFLRFFAVNRAAIVALLRF